MSYKKNVKNTTRNAALITFGASVSASGVLHRVVQPLGRVLADSIEFSEEGDEKLEGNAHEKSDELIDTTFMPAGQPMRPPIRALHILMAGQAPNCGQEDVGVVVNEKVEDSRVPPNMLPRTSNQAGQVQRRTLSDFMANLRCFPLPRCLNHPLTPRRTMTSLSQREQCTTPS